MWLDKQGCKTLCNPIRRAVSADADRLTESTIAAKRHWTYPENWIQLWLPQLTITAEYISNHEVWMAMAEDAAVGYYSLEHLSDELWLGNLWVLPEHMGQGIGRLLFEHTFERSRRLGFSVLKIEADPNAQSFYERMGARKVVEHHSEVFGQPRTLPVMEVAV